MENYNPIREKSKQFALRTIKLVHFLKEIQEFEIAHQLMKSGTSIGANVKEAVRAQSTADFYAKMNISLKEASETEYWLELLMEGEIVEEKRIKPLYEACQELLRILVAITKNQHNNA